jgi:glycosyltransferase involved in cell wall biosynthesis
LRVAFDAGPLLDPPTGVGRYTRELGAALELCNVEIRRFAVALAGRSDAAVSRWRWPARVTRRAWRTFDWPPIERLVGDVDVVHATNFVLPSLRRAEGVVTIHDLSFCRNDTWPGGARLRDLVPWSLERAAVVIVPTSAVAAEVADRYGVSDKRLAVTHEGVSSVFFAARPLADEALARLGISRPFAVAAGALEPRKNLPRLLQAWRRAADAFKGWTLVLAGPKGWGPNLPRTPGVVLTGWVGDETLPGLLAAAEIFCYPSVYEGFGLPPLEAMASGTATLVGSYPAAAEVLGDAALLVNPYDVNEMAEGLSELAKDEARRARLARLGRSHAVAYTWDATASATVRAYGRAVATRGSGD